jgi:MEMO1 family protein
MNTNGTDNPRLRLIDARPVVYEGASYLLLRDPLALSEKNILVPQPYVPLLALCDGTRSSGTLRAALALRYGIYLKPQRIEEFLAALDDALLLENARFRQARETAQGEFRQGRCRIPANAGASYPHDPQELARYLQGFLDEQAQAPTQNGLVRGIISPHIDYERGGPVYAQVWSQAAQAARSADLAILFGTDHFSEGNAITLTRQNYATPYGILPTAKDIVDSLAEVIGPDTAFQGELHHRHEHSIELAAVWLHHVRGGQSIEMVPVLTGSLSALDETALEAFVAVLRRAMEGRRAIVIAAGDLAHVGPAFDGEPVDPEKLIQLQRADGELIDAVCRGDAAGFYQLIQGVQDENNVCGVSPIYLTLRLLAPASGHNHGYATCPADEQNTSVVTICGITLQ